MLLNHTRGRMAFVSATLMMLFFHNGLFAQGYDLTEMYPDKRAMDAANKSVNKGKMDLAVNRYLEAAAYGNKEAQKLIGLSYLDGSGVKQDKVKACAWLRLAATTGDKRLVSAFNDLTQKLSDDDLGDAEKEFKKLQKKYSDTSALKKRKKWVRRELKDSSGSGASRPSPTTRVQVSLTPGRMTTVTYGELSSTLDEYVKEFEKTLEGSDS
jgi:TPR repeat protein